MITPRSGETRYRAHLARLLPLLLNFPEPVEYHLSLIDGHPAVTHRAINKPVSKQSRDTLTPFIDQRRNRLAIRARHAEEAARKAERERSSIGRLTRAGIRISALAMTLPWNDTNDLDLHVECTAGEVLNHRNKQACGGNPDIDRNALLNALTDKPVENIAWRRKPMRRDR